MRQHSIIDARIAAYNHKKKTPPKVRKTTAVNNMRKRSGRK